MGGGRLKSRGKSKRSETPPDGHRSDSTGIVYQFPFQRSSGSVREALRLSRPPELRSAKIFSRLFRCPPPTHTTCPWPLSGFWARKVISFCRHVNFCVFQRRKRQFSIPIHRRPCKKVKSKGYPLPSTAPHSQNRARPPRDPAAHASSAVGGGSGACLYGNAVLATTGGHGRAGCTTEHRASTPSALQQKSRSACGAHPALPCPNVE